MQLLSRSLLFEKAKSSGFDIGYTRRAWIFIFAIAGILLKSELFDFFPFNFRCDSEYLLKNSDILFKCECETSSTLSSYIF